MKPEAWRTTPLFTKGQFVFLIAMLAMVNGLLYVIMPSLVASGGGVVPASLYKLFSTLVIEYVLFWHIPYIIFTRITGRCVPLNYFTSRTTAFSELPLKNGAKPYSALGGYLLFLIWLVVFFVVIVMPTVYVLFH